MTLDGVCRLIFPDRRTGSPPDRNPQEAAPMTTIFPSRAIFASRWPHMVLLAAIACTNVMLNSSCEKKAAGGRGGISVDAEPARKADVSITMRAVGRVEPLQKVEVRSQVGGQIQEVRFAEGDAVLSGQTLYVMDRRPFEAARAQAAAQLKASTIKHDAAKRDLERGRTLFEKQMISAGELDALQTGADSAQAAVQLARAIEKTSTLNLEYTVIKAPISGRAGRHQVFPGDVVIPATTTLVTINQTTPISVAFSVPERELPAVRKSVSAGQVNVTATVPDGTGTPRIGTLNFIDNQVDPGTGSVTMKAIFDNSDEGLWPGQFVQIVAELGRDKDAVVVVSKAVQVGQSGPFVFKLENGSTARLQPVKTGRTSGDDTVILEGIAEGDMIVTDGQLKLADGSRVDIRGTGKPDAGQEAGQ